MLYEGKKDETFGLMKELDTFKCKPPHGMILQRSEELLDVLRNLNPINMAKVQKLPEIGEPGKMYVITKEVPAIIEGKKETVAKTKAYTYADGHYVLVDDITDFIDQMAAYANNRLKKDRNWPPRKTTRRKEN